LFPATKTAGHKPNGWNRPAPLLVSWRVGCVSDPEERDHLAVGIKTQERAPPCTLVRTLTDARPRKRLPSGKWGGTANLRLGRAYAL
jgi:hypothetical protein